MTEFQANYKYPEEQPINIYYQRTVPLVVNDDKKFLYYAPDPMLLDRQRPSRYQGMDNQYHEQGCPAMMSDARIFTSYAPNQTLIDAIKLANNLNVCAADNNDFRLFLQHNASNIMRKEREYLVDTQYCFLKRRPIKVELPFDERAYPIQNVNLNAAARIQGKSHHKPIYDR